MAHVMLSQDINTYDAGIIATDPITGDSLLGEEFPIQEGTRSMVSWAARLVMAIAPPPPPPAHVQSLLIVIERTKKYIWHIWLLT